MSFKNTMKVFSSNFALVWKQVLYFSLGLIFFGICTYQVSKPLLEVFETSSLSAEFTDFFNSFYTRGANLPHAFLEIIRHIFDVIIDNLADIYGSLLLIFLFGIILPYIFFQIGSYNLCSIIYKQLSMNMKVGYIQNLVGTLKHSFIYGVTNIVLNLPFFALKILAFEIYIGVAKNVFLSYIGLMFLSGIFIFLDSLKSSFNSCYVGNAVEHENYAPFAFGCSLYVTIKNFGSILSTCVVLEILTIVANGFIGFFTFFAGLILSIPAVIVLESICFIVLYANKTGQRYYLGNSVIYNPVKYEVKQDDIVTSPIVIEDKSSEQIETTVMKKPKKKRFKKQFSGKNNEIVSDKLGDKSESGSVKFGGFASQFGGQNSQGNNAKSSAFNKYDTFHFQGKKLGKNHRLDGPCMCGYDHKTGKRINAIEDNQAVEESNSTQNQDKVQIDNFDEETTEKED